MDEHALPLFLHAAPLRSPRGTLQIFSHAAAAAAHVDKHVRTPPELFAWLRCAPQLAAVLGEDGARARTAPAQPLYDAYASTILRAVREADVLGWSDVCELTWAYTVFGLGGVIMVAEKRDPARPRWVVVTAYLGAQGRPRQGMQDRRATRREAEWSGSEWYFHRVFRPALQHLRACHYDTAGAPVLREFSRLKSKLPSPAHYPFANWEADCARVAAGGSHGP